MKKLYLLLAILVGTIQAFGTAAASGKLTNPDTTGAVPGYAQFTLYNCGGNFPIVSGSAILSTQQFPLHSDGTWSGVIYRNDEITCNSATSTSWRLQYFVGGRQIGPPRDFVCAQASCNFDAMTPITTSPVVPAPTGDSTYLRRDAGNSPVTGPIQFSSTASLIGGGTFTGTFGGNPTLSGNPAFIGNPTFSNSLSLSSGAGLVLNSDTGEWRESPGIFDFGTSTPNDTSGWLKAGKATFSSDTVLGTATISNITGATQCLQANTIGQITGTGSPCGSSSGGGVTSVSGTLRQISTSGSTGAITLSLPQNIDTTSTPQFSTVTFGGAAAGISKSADSCCSGFLKSSVGFQIENSLQVDNGSVVESANDGFYQWSDGGKAYAVQAGPRGKECFPITATSITTNVLTVTCTNTFSNGETALISSTQEGFLNGQVVTVASASGTQFTANFTHANFSNGSDTGSAAEKYLLAANTVTLPDLSGGTSTATSGVLLGITSTDDAAAGGNCLFYNGATAQTGLSGLMKNSNIGCNGSLTLNGANKFLNWVATNNGSLGVPAGGLSATRTWTMPDASGNIILDTATQTLTNKTLTSPSISSPTSTGTDSGTETLNNKTLASPSVSSPTTTGTDSGTETLSNKTLSPSFVVGSSGPVVSKSAASCCTGFLEVNTGMHINSSLQVDSGSIVEGSNDGFIQLTDGGFGMFIQAGGPRPNGALLATTTLTLPDLTEHTSTAASGFLLGAKSANIVSQDCLMFGTTSVDGFVQDSQIKCNGSIVLGAFNRVVAWTNGTNTGSLDANTLTSNRTWSLPDATGTLVIDTATQTLTNKTIDISANTLKSSTNTAGHVPRNNGTQYVDGQLAASDLSNGTTGSGSIVLATSPTISSPSTTGTDSGTETLQNKTLNGASNGNAVTLLNSQGPAAAITGSAGTDITVFTYTIPANVVGAGKGFKVSFNMVHSLGSANVTYKLKLGTATLFNWSDTGVSNINGYVTVMNASGVQNSQNAIASAADGPTVTLTSFATSAENLAANDALTLTFNVPNTDKVTPQFWLVEVIQ